MVKIIIKEKFGDILYNLLYIVLITMNISVVFLLSAAGNLLKKIHNSEWYSEGIYHQSSTDAFFAEKFKLIYNVSTVFVLISQIVISIILLYIIISHLNKWKTDIALLYTLGYTDKNMLLYLCIRNFFDIICAALFSLIITIIIWKLIVTNKLFSEIIKVSGVGYEINYWKLIFICVIAFAIQMLISIINYQKQKHTNIRNIVED